MSVNRLVTGEGALGPGGLVNESEPPTLVAGAGRDVEPKTSFSPE